MVMELHELVMAEGVTVVEHMVLLEAVGWRVLHKGLSLVKVLYSSSASTSGSAVNVCLFFFCIEHRVSSFRQNRTSTVCSVFDSLQDHQRRPFFTNGVAFSLVN